MITGSMNGNVTQLTNVRNTISVAATEEAMAMVIAVVCIITHSSCFVNVRPVYPCET